MSIAQTLLAELEQQAAVTRKFLERIPEDKLTWKPHTKSMSAGVLALHIATVPGSVAKMALTDYMPDFGKPSPEPSSVQEILTAHDASLEQARELLLKADNQTLAALWSFVVDGKEIMAMPRGAMLRHIMLNHWYQHRGQFSVYLRLLDVAVPSSYGPSADENPFAAAQTQSA